jgi:putative membrane protein
MFPKVLTQFVRGFLMGSADVVPGVSGGTVALVLGIYDRLIETLRTGTRALVALGKANPRGSWAEVQRLDLSFLLPLLAGILVAIGTLAGVIEHQLNQNPEEMAGLFLGLVIGSIIIAWKMFPTSGRSYLLVAIGTGAVLFVLLGFRSGPVTDPSIPVLIGAGAVAICAMILPGISGSFLLLMIGMYGAVIGAVHDRALGDLVFVAFGAVLGLALFSSLLGWLLERHQQPVSAVLMGLMLGSLRVLWPWPNGVGVISDIDTEIVNGAGLDWPTADTWLGPTLLAVLGLLVVLGFARISERLTH